MQDIYYHRPRGLSTVFAKKFKNFFAKQKKVLLPPSGGGRRAFFRPLTVLPRRLRPGVPPCGLWCPVHSAVPPCALGCPRALCGAPMRPCGAPCALWDAPRAPLRCPLRALGCPVRPAMPHALWGCPCAPGGAPVRPALPPVRSGVPPCALAVPPARPGATLHAPRCSAGLRQPCGASRPAIQSAPLPCLATTLSPAPRRPSAPPRGGPLPRPAARQRKSPAAPNGAAGPCSFRCQAMRLG